MSEPDHEAGEAAIYRTARRYIYKSTRILHGMLRELTKSIICQRRQRREGVSRHLASEEEHQTDSPGTVEETDLRSLVDTCLPRPGRSRPGYQPEVEALDLVSPIA